MTEPDPGDPGLVPWTSDGVKRTHPDGSRSWSLNGVRHRLNGPAHRDPHGGQEWWQRGERHRVDGPAVLYPTGFQEWWLLGRPHRLNGPAVTASNGSTEWWVDGQLHRPDGPALERSDGTTEWFDHGVWHRIGGPALTRADGSEEWFVNGIKMTALARLLPDVVAALGDDIVACAVANEDIIDHTAAHRDPAQLRHDLGLPPTGPPTTEHINAWHLLTALR